MRQAKWLAPFYYVTSRKIATRSSASTTPNGYRKLWEQRRSVVCMSSADTVAIALAKFDLTDSTLLQDPYPALRGLRDAAPIVWHEPTQQWLLTRHREVHAALRDKRLGRVYNHRFTDADFGRPTPNPRWEGFRAHERWSLLQLEPPDHTRIRSLISRAFTPGSIGALRPFMQTTAAALLDRCHELGEFDLLADFAQPYSVAVICELLGVRASETRRLLDWSHAIVKMYELTATDDQRAAATTAAIEFMDFIRELISECRAQPAETLLGRLVSAEEHGQRLTDDEIMCTVIVLLNAGHEATVNTIGNGMNAMLHQRDQWEVLCGGDASTTGAVEEMLRFDAPLQLFQRWVLDDGVEIAGQPLQVGSQIGMLFGSANRDDRKFDHASTFDVRRADPTHVGFGGGIHFCIGAPLARLELDVALVALVAAVPNLEMVAEPIYFETFTIRGLSQLLVHTN